MLEKKEIRINPGPGSYNTSGNMLLNKSRLGITLNKREIRFKNLSAKNINTLGPGEYFKNVNFLEKNYKVNKLQKSLSSKNKINRIIKKYINTQDKKDYEVPGPGQYNIKSCFNKIDLLKKSNNKKIQNMKNKNFIPEEIMKEYLIKKRENNYSHSMISNNNINQDSSYIIKKSYENINKSQKIGINLPFVSKSKRIAFLDSSINKHIPGPCYYDLH